MTKTKLLGISVIVVAALVLAFPLGAADAIKDAVDKARIVIFDDEEIITLRVNPTQDPDDLFFKGFAILTTDPNSDGEAGLGTLIAITKHGGVFDSQEQSSPADEVWHAHYVELIQQNECISDVNPSGLAVNPFRISFTSPGDVIVKDNGNIVLRKAPTADYTDINYFAFLNPAPGLPTDNIQSYTLGDVGDGQVVAFDLSLGNHGFFDQAAGIPNGVCVDSVQPIKTKLAENSDD